MLIHFRLLPIQHQSAVFHRYWAYTAWQYFTEFQSWSWLLNLLFLLNESSGGKIMTALKISFMSCTWFKTHKPYNEWIPGRYPGLSTHLWTFLRDFFLLQMYWCGSSTCTDHGPNPCCWFYCDIDFKKFCYKNRNTPWLLFFRHSKQYHWPEF